MAMGRSFCLHFGPCTHVPPILRIFGGDRALTQLPMARNFHREPNIKSDGHESPNDVHKIFRAPKISKIRSPPAPAIGSWGSPGGNFWARLPRAPAAGFGELMSQKAIEKEKNEKHISGPRPYVSGDLMDPVPRSLEHRIFFSISGPQILCLGLIKSETHCFYRTATAVAVSAYIEVPRFRVFRRVGVGGCCWNGLVARVLNANNKKSYCV